MVGTAGRWTIDTRGCETRRENDHSRGARGEAYEAPRASATTDNGCSRVVAVLGDSAQSHTRSWGVIPNLARLLARCLPVAVPEYSPGAEHLAGSEMQKLAALKLQLKKEGKLGSQFLAEAAMEAGLRSPEEVEADANSSYSVAVIGGGVAGCGAAWALKRSGLT